MSSVIFWLSYGVLWAVVLSLLVAVLLLYREFAETLVTGKLRSDAQGPELFKTLPLSLPAMAPGFIGGETSPRWRLIFFAAVNCDLCKQALPALEHFADQNNTEVAILVVCKGDKRDVQQLAKGLPSGISVIPDPNGEIAAGMKTFITPYAVFTGPDDTVLAKGPIRDINPGPSNSFETLWHTALSANQKGREPFPASAANYGPS